MTHPDAEPQRRPGVYTRSMSRQSIIELLDYPRRLVGREIAAQPCPHGGHFSAGHADCRDCWYGLACDWLSHNDECIDWNLRSMADLVTALESAIGQVDAHLLQHGHDRRSCRCDTCNWFRRAQRWYLDWSEAG